MDTFPAFNGRIPWIAWAMYLPESANRIRLIHTIRLRGYELCGATIGRDLTVRAFPLLHGPATRSGRIGYDPIDNEPLPRDGAAWYAYLFQGGDYPERTNADA